MVKVLIKQITIEISKNLNINKCQLAQLERKLKAVKDSDKYIHKQECKNLQGQIKQYYEKQTEATKICSRIQHFEEGEKSTRYFFNLEKAQYN